MNEFWRRFAKPAGIALLGSIWVVAIVSAVIQSRPIGPALPTTIRPAGPPILQLERIGKLAPVRVHVADVLIAEGEGLRGSWLIKGDALLVCDLSQAKITNIDAEHRTAILELPAPSVTSARVDFEKSKTWSVETTTWLPWSGGNQSTFRDAAMFHAQELVEQAAGSEGNLAMARQQAEVVLRNLYGAVNWTVNTTWAP